MQLKSALGSLWTKLYTNEKRKAISDELKDYVKQLETQPVYYLEQKLCLSSNLDSTILEQIKKKKLSEEEVKLVLDYIVNCTINNLIRNYKDEPLVGYCIHAAKFIMQNFAKYFDFLNLYILHTNNVFSSEIGHCFAVANFITDKGEKKYIIDPTYRQFCLLSYCNKERLYHYEPYVMPGYFVKDSSSIFSLLKNGYLELNEHTAKIYGDSFVLATESILKKEIILDSNYTGKQYIKTFINGVSIKNQK